MPGMVVTARDLDVLDGLTRYYVLSQAQIRRLYFPGDQDGRITRRRIHFLLAEKLLNKTHMQVVNPDRSTAAPLYYPSTAGCQLLALRKDDVRYLTVNTTYPQWQNLVHWHQLADLHITIDASVARQNIVTMPAWHNEFDVVNKDAVEPAEKFQLYTQIRKHPRLVCCPDAAFLLQAGAFRKAQYIELECGTNAPQKAAAEKTPGYAALAAQQLHRKHFPGALSSFNVLLFAPNPDWRDALRKAISKKEGATLWRVASLTDVKPETFLFAPIFYPAGEGEPKPLVKGGSQ